jgi:hypothetical protein
MAGGAQLSKRMGFEGDRRYLALEKISPKGI